MTVQSPSFQGHKCGDQGSIASESTIDQLSECSIKSLPHERLFVPISCIDQLVTPVNVRFELWAAGILDDVDSDDAKSQSLVDYICRKAPRTYLTLISMKELGQIKHFVRNLFTDEQHLRLDELTIQAQLKCPTANDASSPLVCAFKAARFDRGQANRKSFCELRWRFLAPVLPLSQNESSNGLLSPNTVLPLLQHSKAGEGGFSTIYRVVIHPAHWKGEVCHEAQNDRMQLSLTTSEPFRTLCYPDV